MTPPDPPTSTQPARPTGGFSYARLALFVLGTGTLVLLVSVPVIYGVSRASAVAALVVALLAVAVAIAAMGIVANRMVDTAARRMHTGAPSPERTPPTDRPS